MKVHVYTAGVRLSNAGHRDLFRPTVRLRLHDFTTTRVTRVGIPK